MNKSALKYLTRTRIAPEERLIRDASFATNRTQQRKRPVAANVRSSACQPCKKG